MNHYPHHIGDFDKATRHLTRIERSIYRDLIELYYDTETQLTLDISALCRRILARTNEEVTAVEQTLNEFFNETPTGWFHSKCELEIEKYLFNKSNHWGSKLTKAERNAIEAARNAAKINATPLWLSKEQKQATAAIYAESAMLTASSGIPHEVDHIVPLRSSLVCGLHVHWNLRVITASDNRAKSNLLVEV